MSEKPKTEPKAAKPKTVPAATAAKATEAAAAPVDSKEKTEPAQNQQAQEATETSVEKVAKQEPKPKTDAPAAAKANPVEPLADFIARVERAKLDKDVVAVAITHPEVHADRVHPGTYGGIRLSAGDAAVTYSDGSAE